MASSEEEGLHARPLPHNFGVHRRGRDRPSPSQRRCVRRLLVGCAVQVVRGQERVGLLTVGTLRRYHQSELGCVMHTGAGRNRSGRFATPCSGCVKQACHVRVGLPADQPSAVCAQGLCWALHAVKCHTRLRGEFSRCSGVKYAGHRWSLV